MAADNDNANNHGKLEGPLREKHRAFANTLTKNLYTNDNECSSTWGISLLFDLLLSGAAKDTGQELCKIMGLCTSSQQQQQFLLRSGTDSQAQALLWSSTVDEITNMYDGSCTVGPFEQDGSCEQNRPLVAVANSVWIDDESSANPNYLLIVGEYLKQIDFEGALAGQQVNNWVNASTLGLIDSILDDPGPIAGDLVGVNSIYLNAGWKDFFQEPQTNEDVFYKDHSRTTPLSEKAHFMHMAVSDRKFPYSAKAIRGYQILELPYQQPVGLSMLLVLPMNDDVPMVSSAEVVSAKKKLQDTAVVMAIPKFQFESAYTASRLKQALKATGMEAPFSLDPDKGFCGLLTGRCCSISKVIQKTVIHVNERGTVAAAVTAVLLDTGLPPQQKPDPVEFKADHPFQFFICDSNTDVCLFEGRVGAPNPPKGSVAELQAVHSDENFWTDNFAVENVIIESDSSSVGRKAPTMASWMLIVSTMILGCVHW